MAQVVVSLPFHVASGVLDDLSPFGAVRALVASNAFHHLGLSQWNARFPDAAIFAPAQSIARGLELVDMPHYETGEVLVRSAGERGSAWYVTDIIMNLPALPANPIVSLMFRLSGSGRGLKFNNVAPLFMVKDKAALRRWIAEEFRRAPPDWLIAAHGDIVDPKANPAAGRMLFGAR